MSQVYAPQQSVLETAGLWQRILAEEAMGTVDGANKTFTVSHKPLADNNYDDVIDHDDVVAYVDGLPVQVTSVSITAGSVVLTTAPATSAVVTIDYSYSVISQDAVAGVIEEAGQWVDDEMSAIVSTPYTRVPSSIRRITRWYAAGLLMGEQTGITAVNEGGTSEGAAKITQAEKWLATYRTRMAGNGADTGTIVVPRSSAVRRVFSKQDSEGVWGPTDDEQFDVNGAA